MEKFTLTNAQANMLCSKLEDELHWPLCDRSYYGTNEEINEFIFRLTPSPHSTSEFNDYFVDSDQASWIRSELVA